MARIKIKDNNKIPQAIKTIEKINRKKVKVGYFTGDFYNGNGELTVKGLAAVHEFGVQIQVTPKMRSFLHHKGLHLKDSTTHITIPERSFVRTGADQSRFAVVQKTEELIRDAITGNIQVELLYEMIGEEMRAEIREHAIDLQNPANHPWTIENKGSSNPLVATGNMIGAMEVEVK